MLDILFTGIGTEMLNTLNRVALGVFFAISGYHKLFVPISHKRVANVMREDGIPFPRFNEWFVPGVEFAAGLALIVGLVTPLAALGLLVICLVATLTDAIWRLPERHPLDKCDWVAKTLYLPEVLYIIMLFMVIESGAGRWSVDHYIHTIIIQYPWG